MDQSPSLRCEGVKKPSVHKGMNLRRQPRLSSLGLLSGIHSDQLDPSAVWQCQG